MSADLNAEFNNVLNNPISLISPLTGALDLDGQTITLDAAAATTFASTGAVSWNFTSGAKAGTPATTGSVANWAAQTFTDSNTAGSGTATNYVAFAIQRPTLAATNASVVTTNAATFYIPNAPAAGTNQTITNAYALWTDDGRVRHDLSASVVSAAGATLDALNLTAQTATISGSTNITTATGVNFVAVGLPTLSASSALTITNAATVYIAGAPAGSGAGPATITNAYALWVDDGTARFDGIINATGGQIAFPATQVPSSNANTLDDYEEFTFTPAITFGGASVGITYSFRVGIGTKIGNTISYLLSLQLTSKGSSVGSAAVSGLPTASRNSANVDHTPAFLVGSMAAGLTQPVMAQLVPNATAFDLFKLVTGSATAIADTDFGNTSIIRLSGTYFV